MRRLKDVLIEDFGLADQLAGWRFKGKFGAEDLDISDDGLTIVGNGFNPKGERQGWMAILDPRLLPGDFDMNGSLDANDIDLLSQEIRLGNNDLDFDLNDDAVVDQEDHRVWVKDLRKTWFGDANLDGLFTSADLVGVLAAGKFEVDADAGWGEGDWTADQRFTSGDVVEALADGGFDAGPVTAIAAVPEPSSGILLAIGIIGLCRFRTKESRFSGPA